MVIFSPKLNTVFTSNVKFGTISIVEQVDAPMPNFGRRPAHPGSAPPPGPRLARRERHGVSPTSQPAAAPKVLIFRQTQANLGRQCAGRTVTIIDVATKKALQTLPISVRAIA